MLGRNVVKGETICYNEIIFYIVMKYTFYYVKEEKFMKKEIKRFLLGGTALLSLLVAGCSKTKTDNETSQVKTTKSSTKKKTPSISEYKTDSKNPGAAFDWNLVGAGLKDYKREFYDIEGKRVIKLTASVLDAVGNLQKTKSEITDSKVLAALKLLDAVYVDQSNIGDLVQAAGVSNQKELYEKIWNEYMIEDITKNHPTFNNDATAELDGVTYPIKVYGPMKLKIYTNSLAQAGAYELLNYKVEGDMVYLKYNAPSMEGDTQVHYSKEQKNNQAFLNEIKEETEKSSGQDYNKNLIMRTIFTLATVQFKGDGSFGVEGSGEFHVSGPYYLAVKVDENGKTSIDLTNLLALIQIHSKSATEANEVKFQKNQ